VTGAGGTGGTVTGGVVIGGTTWAAARFVVTAPTKKVAVTAISEMMIHRRRWSSGEPCMARPDRWYTLRSPTAVVRSDLLIYRGYSRSVTTDKPEIPHPPGIAKEEY
jgi:hypothetical protein